MAKNKDISVDPRVAQGFDKLLSVQRPIVLAHIRGIRARHPEATPQDVIRILEKRYLTAVTTGGAAVGASAVIPGVGTAASLVLSGAETVGFLEASALFAQSVTELHGIAVIEPERASTLVMAMMLGSGGQDLVRQLAGQFSKTGPGRTAFWGELVTSSMPRAVVGQVTDRVKRSFMKHFATRAAGSTVGRAIPFGVGAVVGGTGNHVLGRRVITAARQAFPPPPLTFPSGLDRALKAGAADAMLSPHVSDDPEAKRARRLTLPQLGRKRRLPENTATVSPEA